jgi:hypothetical protein
VLAIFRQIHPDPTSVAELTPHELHLLRLLTEGYNYKTAAVCHEREIR